MIIFFVMIAVVSAMVAIGAVIHINAHKEKKLKAQKEKTAIEKKDTRYWSDITEEADGFYNLVKDSLPRDLGLIYELEVVKNSNRQRGGFGHYTFLDGEQIVVIKVYDPIQDKNLGKLELSERLAYRDSSSYKVTEFRYETLPGKIKKMVQDEKKKGLVGRKEIVS